MTTKILVKHCLRLLLAWTALATVPVTQATESKLRVIGEAYDLKSDEFLYREIHCAKDNPKEMEVIYRNDEERMIARKLLDYSSGPTTPSFVQQNFYSSEVIEVNLKAGNVIMAVLDAVNAEPKKVSSAQIDGSAEIVIDAGFDEFIRTNWNSLLAGEKKSFLFPFVERDSLIELRIRKFGCSYESETDQCFKLELSNWFVRMLVSPIELGYDPVLQRLKRYRGLSNIGDGKGNGLVVDIRYDYQKAPELACSITDRALTNSVEPTAKS